MGDPFKEAREFMELLPFKIINYYPYKACDKWAFKVLLEWAKLHIKKEKVQFT